MTVSEYSRKLRQRLAAEYGEHEAEAMVRLIFHSLKGWDTTALIVNGNMEVSEWLESKIEDIMTRLAEHEPLQYVLGEARFYGMDLAVDRSVLIPRPETAELVDMIVREAGEESDLQVLDIGTGSGAIAIALSRNLRFPEVTAIDISADALRVAKNNAERLKARVRFEHRDIFTYEPEPERLDIIVSNPPYIPDEERETMERNVVDYEPGLALFVSDAEPLIYYSRIIEVASRGLKRGGRLYFEINARFGEEMRRLMEDGGFEGVRIERDSYGRDRFAIGVRK